MSTYAAKPQELTATGGMKTGLFARSKSGAMQRGTLDMTAWIIFAALAPIYAVIIWLAVEEVLRTRAERLK